MNSARDLMMYCLWQLFFSPSNIISSTLTRSTTTTSHSVCIVASLMLSLLILAVDPGSSDRDLVPSKIYSSLPVQQHIFKGYCFRSMNFISIVNHYFEMISKNYVGMKQFFSLVGSVGHSWIHTDCLIMLLPTHNFVLTNQNKMCAMTWNRN